MNRRELVILAIITFITVFAWIVFGIMETRNISEVTSLQTQQVIPLTPGFDNEIINQLEDRED